MEGVLREQLPRPVPDAQFADRLLRAVLGDDADWDGGHLDHPVWRRLSYVGGALAGAAALALGAALGWRRVRVGTRSHTSGRAA